mgnify:CR=1 FL=1
MDKWKLEKLARVLIRTGVNLQEGETVAYRWVSREELLHFMHSDEAIPTQKERWLPHLERL